MNQLIKGKILAIDHEEQVSPKFKKREFVIQTLENYPKTVCFQLVNDRVDLIDPYKLNEVIEVYYNAESKQYNGRWFTNLTAWKIEKQAYNQGDDTHENHDSPW